MNKKLIRVVSLLLTTIALTACTNTVPESETIVIANKEVTFEVENYGFGEASYENQLIEGLNTHELIDLNPYGETEKETEIAFKNISNFLKEQDIINEDYITIFKDTSIIGKEFYYVMISKLKNDVYFCELHILEGIANQNDFDIVAKEIIDGSINPSKISMHSINNHLLISTEAPGWPAVTNHYLEWSDELNYLRSESFDPMYDYLEAKIAFLENNELEKALSLKPVYLYPHNYELLLSKANNLGLKRFYPYAKELVNEKRWKEAQAYLGPEVLDYMDRAFLSADNINDFIEDEADKEYGLGKEEIIEIFEFYKTLLIANEDEFYIEYVDIELGVLRE